MSSDESQEQDESAAEQPQSKWEQLLDEDDGELLAAEEGGPLLDATVLQQQLESAQEALKAKEEQLLRQQAETQNFQRRAEINVANAHKYAIEKFIVALLPVVDGLERGIAACADTSLATAKEGMEMSLQMFLDVLQKFAVEILNPVGEKFDPSCHEAISMQADITAETNTVLTVVQKGYSLNGRVIRPAMVIVCSGA